MTLTEAYEAMIKLLPPEKLKRDGDRCHGGGMETLENTHNEAESETLPVIWQNLMPECVDDLH